MQVSNLKDIHTFIYPIRWYLSYFNPWKIYCFVDLYEKINIYMYIYLWCPTKSVIRIFLPQKAFLCFELEMSG